MRADLLALDDEALVALANRGLVKRARKEVDRGDGPEVALEGDDVVGTFADGTVSRLPPDVPLRDAPCSCGALKLCRHRLATVMAWRARDDSEATPRELPPIDVSDDTLLGRLGKRVFQRALRSRRDGYTARVRFGDSVEVLLATCTVRFLVPWELAHVRCDCKQGVDCEHVALAVWAVTEVADPTGEQRVEVGQADEPEVDEGVLADVLEVQQALLGAGWTGGGEVLTERLALLVTRLEKERMVWLADTVSQLVQVLEDYARGDDVADADEVGALIGELGTRAAARGPRSDRVGAQASGATDLDHTVLRGVGARYRVEGSRPRLQLFFVEGGGRDALVLERFPKVDDEGTAPTGPTVGARRLLGSPTRTMAAGNVTTKAATRRPNRRVEVRGRSSRQTAVTPGSRTGLASMAEPLEAVRARLSRRDPAPVAARVRAWRVVVVPFDRVRGASWDPGRQAVWAWVGDGTNEALLVQGWRPEAPGGPTAVAKALQEGEGLVAAEAHLTDGRLVLEPLLVCTGAGLVAPDLAPDEPRLELPVGAVPEALGRHGQVVADTQRLLSELAQRGLQQLTSPQIQRVTRQVEALRSVGLSDLAGLVEELREGERVEPWRGAWARAMVLEHLCARGRSHEEVGGELQHAP